MHMGSCHALASEEQRQEQGPVVLNLVRSGDFSEEPWTLNACYGCCKRWSSTFILPVYPTLRHVCSAGKNQCLLLRMQSCTPCPAFKAYPSAFWLNVLSVCSLSNIDRMIMPQASNSNTSKGAMFTSCSEETQFICLLRSCSCCHSRELRNIRLPCVTIVGEEDQRLSKSPVCTWTK